MSGENAVYAYGNASNFKLEEPTCFYGGILSHLVRKDVTKFRVKFSHFQYATLEMFKTASNNYLMLKLRFFNQHLYFSNVL